MESAINELSNYKPKYSLACKFSAENPQQLSQVFAYNSAVLCETKGLTAYFRVMNLSHEHQELVEFFSGRELPTGPQHINDYSVMLNLSGAVTTRLQQLYSEVEATRKSAALMLCEVKDWLVMNAQAE